jgi:TP901 family phage tail tape measure protein
MVTAASLVAKISVEGADKAKGDMDSVKGKVDSVAGSVRSFAIGAAAVGATALIGIGVASTKMAGDFQAGITSLVTGAGEAQSNIKLVSDGILSMATSTGTSTKQLTDGMYMIESAGFHGAAGLDVLKTAAQGAKVGNADLKDVANGVTTALTDYGLSAKDSASVTNDLVATVASGKTTMGELSSSLKDVLPIASTAGISLNGVSAAMATMTGEGVPAGQAANYLRGMILALQAPSSEGAKMLASIGLSAQDVASEMKDSLPGALQMITEHLKTKFPEGSAAYIDALKQITGGSESLTAMLDLTGDHMKTFTGNVDNIASAVKTGGSSITGWSNVQDTFNFKMDKAKEVLETIGIKIGTQLLPVLGRLVDGFSSPAFQSFATQVGALVTNALTNLANAITTAVNIGTNLTNFFQHNQPALEALKIGLIVLAGVLGGIVVASFVMATIAAWNMAIAFLANPVVWIAIAIGVAVALIVVAIMHWGDIVKWLQGIWAAFSSWFMGILGAIGSFFVGIWNGIASFFVGIWNGIVSGVQAALNGIASFFTAVWNGIVASLQAAWNTIVNVIKIGAMLALAVLFAPILTIAALFIWLYNHNYYFQALVDNIINFFKMLFSWAVAAWNAFVAGLVATWQGLVNIATALWNALTAAVKFAVNSVVTGVKVTWQGAVNLLMGLWNGLVGGASATWNAVSGAIRAGFNAAVGFVRGVWSAISSVFSSAWGTYIAGPIGSLWNSLSSTISGWATSAWTWGSNLINGFINGIKDKIGQIGATLGHAAETVKNFLGFHSPTKEGPGREADEWAPAFVDMFAGGIEAGIPQIQRAVSQLMRPIDVSLNPLGTNFSGSLTPSGSFAPASFAAVSSAPASNGPQTVIFEIDGRQFARATLPATVEAIRTRVGVRNV